MEQAEIEKGIVELWGGTPTGEMCLLLVERILAIKPEAAAALSYKNLLELAELNHISHELMSAVNVLTTSEFAILNAGGFFVDDDDDSFELSPEALEMVVSENYLIHPDLGQPVDDPATKVSPFFSLREDLRRKSGL